MHLIRRLPFTIFMEVVIIGMAVANGAVLGELSPATQLRWGFGLHSLWESRWYTLFTAPFFVRNLRMFLGILLFMGYSVGVYEWVASTRQAVFLYWITNILGLVLAAALVVAPLYSAGMALGKEWALKSDVGPSAGGLGCIGGWVSHLSDRYRRWVFLAVMVYLIGKLAFSPELFADAAHLITFPLGFLVGRINAKA